MGIVKRIRFKVLQVIVDRLTCRSKYNVRYIKVIIFNTFVMIVIKKTINMYFNVVNVTKNINQNINIKY